MTIEKITMFRHFEKAYVCNNSHERRYGRHMDRWMDERNYDSI